MTVVERAADAGLDIVDRHGGSLVGAATALIAGVLTAADGLSASTVAGVGLFGASLSILTIAVKALVTDLRSVRARLRELQDRDDHRVAEMAERIRQLEDRLGER